MCSMSRLEKPRGRGGSRPRVGEVTALLCTPQICDTRGSPGTWFRGPPRLQLVRGEQHSDQPFTAWG